MEVEQTKSPEQLEHEVMMRRRARRKPTSPEHTPRRWLDMYEQELDKSLQYALDELDRDAGWEIDWSDEDVWVYFKAFKAAVLAQACECVNQVQAAKARRAKRKQQREAK